MAVLFSHLAAVNQPTVLYVLLASKRYCVGACGTGEMGGTLKSMERMRLRLGVDVGHDGVHACNSFQLRRGV